MKYGFGIDLGGTTVKLAYFNEEGLLLDKWEIPTRSQDGGRQILPDIAQAVADYLEKHRIPREQILGLGIGVPGPVSRDGVVNKCVNLGWGVLPIEKQLRELTGFPVKAGNDANVAALGEAWKGGGMGYESLVMATLGTGVGGGIILDGKILYGARGAAGEIGHMVLNRKETLVCGCGKKGCVEQYCSASGIARTAREQLASHEKPSSLRTVADVTAKDVFDASAAGDEVAKEILETVYDRLAEFTANLANCFDPEAIVLGGGVSKAGPVLLEGIARHFKKYVFHAMADVKFVLATLGNDAGAYGAFKLVLDQAV